ncbi:MAG: 6,7-dimethyl-8-ribityllumazine synthase [Gammaproteobacteria bacterium]|jgi:6,7-dimethyl-8-ribityllumazine synthase|uniref:6,7-dimethyl-8-ribityllumazine synthase n=1 Tax=SAR86 cluster bacterium TaxID=2030880 RepID=A0A520MS45_9GAMM|nr:6,7-dimethyl-8-ribityllumazine synthase [Gammaproteobacteria bacterium]RZO24028.1 MAG: 6,7-dimethyl-8-ribityllumazine synthase [SAR86 cluster bacterium]|tara:strand:+ start:914 stop:1366 length:453 start_codon:yes stop_codon:yes gene_type:complete
MNDAPDFKDCFNNIAKKKILIVSTTWNKDLLSPLMDVITKTANDHKVDHEISFCPGSLELAASIIRAKPDQYDGVLAIGLVIRGDTPHFKLVSKQSFQDLASVALEFHSTPLINGVLTVDNKVQAEERINPEKMNKGKEFIESLFQMMSS